MIPKNGNWFLEKIMLKQEAIQRFFSVRAT
jgi:hypothetical protein